MCVKTKRVLKNADLRHPSCTVVMYRRKSASPIHNVLTWNKQTPFENLLWFSYLVLYFTYEVIIYKAVNIVLFTSASLTSGSFCTFCHITCCQELVNFLNWSCLPTVFSLLNKKSGCWSHDWGTVQQAGTFSSLAHKNFLWGPTQPPTYWVPSFFSVLVNCLWC